MEAASTCTGEELSLWRQLRAEGSPAAREALLATHLPYAKVVAATYFGRRYSDEVEFGDYLQYASVGLLEALERFDPDRGAQFRTFAARRMHGAILNGIERHSERQQQIAWRQRLRSERLASLQEGEPEAARLAGDKLFGFVADLGLGLALAWLLEGTGLLRVEEEARPQPFYQHAEVRQARERLLQAVQQLPAQERAVIRSHYLQEQPFEEIASRLQLTKGRISQIHKSALRRLRGSVGEGLATTF